MSEPHNEPIAQAKLHWYRIPLDRTVLAELNQRSDALGFAQTLGHLGVISATGTLSWYASQHWGWFGLAACLFPEHKPAGRRELFTWARILFVGHTLIVCQAVFTGWWMLAVLITLAPFYGGLLLFLCNNTQHVGLQDEVEDFRLCTRTIYLNPIVQVLYWHMNYHIEHHMYAGVPCYKLARLHRAIKHELPYTANGLYETWSIIIDILRRQKQEPSYQFVPELPAKAGV